MGVRHGSGDEERQGPNQNAAKALVYEKFVKEKIPEFQWQMEVDLFRHGDEVEAAKRMCAHIEKNINHSSARKWSKAFVELIRPKETTDS